jgi:hypothetical protein
MSRKTSKHKKSYKDIRHTRKQTDDSWIIAIPSYKRAETLKNKTLSVLKAYNIPQHRIYIFVANNEEKELYTATLNSSEYNSIIVGVPGLAEVRNFIADYFSIGKHIVFMDDDITGFLEYDESEKRKERPLRSLINIIKQGFKECIKHNCTLWGVYPIPNGFFMKPTVTTDLKFIIGSFWGWINPGASSSNGIHLEISEKEDYLRTIKAYIRDGCVVRLNFVAPKTAYYKEPGGMQTDPQRLEKQEKAVKWLENKYPEFVKRNPARKSGFPEIRIKAPKKS